LQNLVRNNATMPEYTREDLIGNFLVYTYGIDVNEVSWSLYEEVFKVEPDRVCLSNQQLAQLRAAFKDFPQTEHGVLHTAEFLILDAVFKEDLWFLTLLCLKTYVDDRGEIVQPGTWELHSLLHSGYFWSDSKIRWNDSEY
jgi:hypothetical protein